MIIIFLIIIVIIIIIRVVYLDVNFRFYMLDAFVQKRSYHQLFNVLFVVRCIYTETQLTQMFSI